MAGIDGIGTGFKDAISPTSGGAIGEGPPLLRRPTDLTPAQTPLGVYSPDTPTVMTPDYLRIFNASQKKLLDCLKDGISFEEREIKQINTLCEDNNQVLVVEITTKDGRKEKAVLKVLKGFSDENSLRNNCALDEKRLGGEALAFKVPEHLYVENPIALLQLHIRDDETSEYSFKESLPSLGPNRFVAGVFYPFHEEAKDLLNIVLEQIEEGKLTTCKDRMDFIMEAAYQYLLGLIHLHQHGLVHRDIKPENLLRIGEDLFRVIDMGLLKKVEENRRIRERANSGVGSPGYMPTETIPAFFDNEPPRIATSLKITNFSIDSYGFGAFLHTLIFMWRPFAFGMNAEDPNFHKDLQNRILDIKEKFPPDFKYSDWFTSVCRDEEQVEFLEANPDLKDLLNQLLCFDPTERKRLSAVLDHPFFAGRRTDETE